MAKNRNSYCPKCNIKMTRCYVHGRKAWVCTCKFYTTERLPRDKNFGQPKKMFTPYPFWLKPLDLHESNGWITQVAHVKEGEACIRLNDLPFIPTDAKPQAEIMLVKEDVYEKDEKGRCTCYN